MINCAELYAEKGQPEKGIALFDSIIKLEFQPAAKWIGYSYRAQFYQKIGQYQKAIDDLTFINSGREIPITSVLVRRGDLYILTKEFDKAVADYETAKTFDKSIEAKMNEKIAAAKQKSLENSNQLR